MVQARHLSPIFDVDIGRVIRVFYRYSILIIPDTLKKKLSKPMANGDGESCTNFEFQIIL